MCDRVFVARTMSGAFIRTPPSDTLAGSDSVSEVTDTDNINYPGYLPRTRSLRLTLRSDSAPLTPAARSSAPALHTPTPCSALASRSGASRSARSARCTTSQDLPFVNNVFRIRSHARAQVRVLQVVAAYDVRVTAFVLIVLPPDHSGPISSFSIVRSNASSGCSPATWPPATSMSLSSCSPSFSPSASSGGATDC